VELSNLPRQTLYSHADVGLSKAEAAAAALRRLAPATRIEAQVEAFAAANGLALAVEADLLVDGSDDVTTRYLASDAAELADIPLVWGAAHRYAGQVGIAWASRGPTYRDLFPEPPDPETLETCEVAGILGPVCTVVGGLMATEALKLLTGIGEPLLGRAWDYDGLSGSFHEIRYEKSPPPLVEERRPRVDVSRNPPTAERPMDDTTLTPAELQELLATDPDIQLVDVREPWEVAIAAIPGAIVLPLGQLPSLLEALDPDRPVVAYCHHGVRSERARQILAAADWPDARHLGGGIEAWAREVDPQMARY
jgi:adenylyltransferase/sulfurtransferase